MLDTSHRIEWRFAAGVNGMRQTLLHSGVCQTDVRQHHCRVDGLRVGTHDGCCRQLGCVLFSRFPGAIDAECDARSLKALLF
jgi:hypothetical protein